MEDYSNLNDALVEQLKAKVAAYNKAARKFLRKVDAGQARSVETYRELKAALEMPEEASGHRL